MPGSAIVVGVVTRTGSGVVVALSGAADGPWFCGRWEIGLMPPDLAAQPNYAAAGPDLAAAGQLIGQTGRGAEDAAAAGLRAAADTLPAGAICGVAVVVKAVSVPDHLADLLRSRTWMHAAASIFYRQAGLAAAGRSGWRAYPVEVSALPPAEQVLAMLGQLTGRPWRRIEKDAARGAITFLRPAGPG